MNQIDSRLETSLISYCGFYCGACKKFKNEECKGCKGDTPGCAVGYKACEIKPCCIGNGLNSCADCDTYDSVKNCKIYNPFVIRFGQFITQTSRRKGVEMIKEKGEAEFVKFMAEKDWVTIKLGNIKS